MRNPYLGSSASEGRSTSGNRASNSGGDVSDVDELVAVVRETGTVEDIYNNVGVLARGGRVEYARVRKQLKEETGVNLNQLDAAVREARQTLEEKQRREARSARRKAAEEQDVPIVQVTGRQSSTVVDDLCAAAENANDPPRIFRRENEIVRPSTDENDRMQLAEVSDAFFDDLLSRCTNCMDQEYRPRDPSKRLVERVAERVDLPPLRGITQVPLLRPDGTVVSEPGYDEATRHLYSPGEDMGPVVIPNEPTSEEIATAREWLREAWYDHPFVGEASWTNMVGLALTRTVRPLLDGANVPLSIIDAPKQGSGKDLAAQIAGLASTGQYPGTMSNPSGKEEWRKQITAQLVRGEPFVLVCDVTGTLDNAPLRRVLTTPTWSDRILGATRQVRLPADAVWCATGNNLRPTGDMVRRCFLIRIDTEMERPWTRDDFKYQQPEWAWEHRGQLAAALLTLARAWIVAGRPDPDTPTLGSFEEWCRVVGGILQYAGFQDFLGNQDELTDTEFSEDNQWSRLLEAIHTWQQKVRDGDPFTARDLAKEIETYDRARLDSEGSLIGPIVDHLPEHLRRKVLRNDPITRSLGKTFGWNKDRPYPGGWVLKVVERDRAGNWWTVECGESDPGRTEDSKEHTRTPTSENEGEVGETATETDPNLSSQHHDRSETYPF